MKTVLIADDSTFLRMILKNLFAGTYRIVEAASGEEAVALFAKEQPDLVLLDIVMPHGEGREALGQIRKLDASARVIMLTAVGQEAVMEECRKMGAIDYLTKPFDEKAIVQTVKGYLT